MRPPERKRESFGPASAYGPEATIEAAEFGGRHDTAPESSHRALAQGPPFHVTPRKRRPTSILAVLLAATMGGMARAVTTYGLTADRRPTTTTSIIVPPSKQLDSGMDVRL